MTPAWAETQTTHGPFTTQLMVNRADIRTLNENTRELMEALDELEALHEQSQRSGVTVDDTAYADAQERVKAAVADLVNASDDMVDRTGDLEDDDGNVLVSLPNAALQRDGSSKTLPDSPSQ